MKALRTYIAELVGTFWLVLCGCGSVLIAADFHTATGGSIGIGLLGVAFAFGLSLMTMVYVIGPVSGCHINPAVTIGLTVAGRFESKHVVPYIVAQMIGATAAAFLLKLIMLGNPSFDAASSAFGANGFGAQSPGHYSMQAAFITEAVMTCFFLLVILGATHKRAPAGFAGLIIGLCLTLIHIVAIPVTGVSVNPARSFGPALVAGSSALNQLWLFWAAPIAGAVVAALIYPHIAADDEDTAPARAAVLDREPPSVAATGD